MYSPADGYVTLLGLTNLKLVYELPSFGWWSIAFDLEKNQNHYQKCTHPPPWPWPWP